MPDAYKADVVSHQERRDWQQQSRQRGRGGGDFGCSGARGGGGRGGRGGQARGGNQNHGGGGGYQQQQASQQQQQQQLAMQQQQQMQQMYLQRMMLMQQQLQQQQGRGGRGALPLPGLAAGMLAPAPLAPAGGIILPAGFLAPDAAMAGGLAGGAGAAAAAGVGGEAVAQMVKAMQAQHAALLKQQQQLGASGGCGAPSCGPGAAQRRAVCRPWSLGSATRTLVLVPRTHA